MRYFSLLFCLIASLAPASAQPSPIPFAPATSTFGGLLAAPLVVHREKMSLEALRGRGQVAEISLRGTGRNETATLAAIGADSALLLGANGQELKSLREIAALYGGEASTLSGANSALWIENPVQVVPITSLGQNAEVVATFALKNRGIAPLDIAVASTSCGCTAATLEKNRLESGQSTVLQATMHADDERLVRVMLRTSDANSPLAVVALQSKRLFAPFALPSPLSLFGEKGQALSAKTQFELPTGWKIARVEASPAWLQTRLETLPTRFGLAIEAPASAPEGALQGRVTLRLEGAPLQTLEIPVSGFISNDVSASPRMVILGEIASGIARRTVVVRGPKPFSIVAVRGDAIGNTPGLKASVDPRVTATAHAAELLIPVEGALGESFFRRATLELSDGRELSIDIAGTVAAGRLPAIAQNLVTNGNAPAFRGVDSAGQTVSLSAFRGRKNVLLTFFPHCFTGGCESHLASLQSVAKAMGEADTAIIAVSTDGASSIEKFARQLGLSFPVLSDADRQISLRYGAVQTATEAPSRLSILIDKTGAVRFIDTDVHVQTHGADMLTKIRELGLMRQP